MNIYKNAYLQKLYVNVELYGKRQPIVSVNLLINSLFSVFETCEIGVINRVLIC